MVQTDIVLAAGAELTFERMQNANPVSAGLAALAMLALALAGCGSERTADAAPAQKGPSDHFTINVGGHPAWLQLAVLAPEQEHGLMQRPDLGKDEGMIFIYRSPQSQSYWMRNCPEPLDIAFATPDGAIAEIYPMYPFDERPVNSRSGQIQFAVEMPQGWYAANGVRPGASVDLKAVAEALRARGFDPKDYKLP
jgi:uncharacterized membrane protein (UPF0127 family)